MGFYGSNDPTNRVKALKEDRVLRISFPSHQVQPTMLNVSKQTNSYIFLTDNTHTSITILLIALD